MVVMVMVANVVVVVTIVVVMMMMVAMMNRRGGHGRSRSRRSGVIGESGHGGEADAKRGGGQQFLNHC